MSTPPDLPEWLLRVRDTLATLGVMDPDLRDEVIRQVQEAVDASEEEDEPPPSITLLRGGLDASPHLDHEPPPLQLVDERETPSRVHVQVLSPRDLGPRAELRDGHLRLPPDTTSWQTFVHGESPAVYRVHCDEGTLQVATEADLTLHLSAGQSVDLTGIVLRARAATPDHARGRFRRLAGEA